MSCFIELLRHHEHDFLHQYESQLNHPIRQAIKALLRCRTSEQHKETVTPIQKTKTNKQAMFNLKYRLVNKTELTTCAISSKIEKS